MNEQAEQKLAVLKKAIRKEYGDGSVMTLDEKPNLERDQIIETGSLALDAALGIGGYPRGRIIEVYGTESAGKTTLTLHAVANAQAIGGTCGFIDMEQALDTFYAEKIGVDVNSILLSQPDHAEQALNITLMMVNSGSVDLVVVDSVAALVPEAEVNGDMDNQFMGLQARIMGKALRKLAPATRRTGCTVIFVNQIRQKIGVVYGSNETTPGGISLPYYASQRLDIRRAADIKENDEIIGQTVRVTVRKNKLAPPKRIAKFDILYGVGIDKVSELIDFAVMDGIFEKGGAWFKYEEEKMQGKKAVRDWLLDNPKIIEMVRKQILENRGLQ
jgi:recombination protein RecA